MKNENLNDSVYDTTIRLLILLLIVGWCLMIIYPFVSIILWSLILAMALHPLHSKLSGKMGGKPKLTSFIIVFSILVIVLLPTGLLTFALFDEVQALKLSYLNGTLTIPPPAEKVKEWPVIGGKLFDFWQNLSANLQPTIMQYKDQLLEIGIKIGKGILSAAGSVIQILISLMIAGVLLVIGGAGEAIRKFFRKVFGNRGDKFADLTLNTVGSVVKGILGEALLLALMHGVVFFLAGIPYPGIWTLLVFVLATLQIPIYVVTVPIMIYLFASKEIVPAVLWFITMVLVSASDNILTPLMLGKRAPVPMLVIYIGVIGGFILSGFIGLFTGAIVMSVGYNLFVGWINSNDAEV